MLHFLCLLRQFAIHALCYFLCFVAPTCKVFHDGNCTLNTNTSIALLAEYDLCYFRGRILIYRSSSYIKQLVKTAGWVVLCFLFLNESLWTLQFFGILLSWDSNFLWFDLCPPLWAHFLPLLWYLGMEILNCAICPVFIMSFYSSFPVATVILSASKTKPSQFSLSLLKQLFCFYIT